MAIELKVPEVGESVTEVFIGSWLKQEGDSVSADEPVVELETDKATMEAPAPVSGKLVKLLKAEGDSATVGEVIAHIEEGAAGAEAPGEEAQAAATPTEGPAPAAAEQQDEPAQEPAAPAPQKDGAGAGRDDLVMPAARRLLEEHGLNAHDVQASGPGGRLLKEDVERHLEEREAADAAAATQAVPTGSPSGAVDEGHRQEETVRMSPLRRTIATRLVGAQQTAALLTTFNEIDMSNVMAMRKEYRDDFEKRYEVRLGFMSFFVKATIDALKQFPEINAEIRENNIVYKNYYDIGVAVSTERGLLVPVIRNAERLSFAEIEGVIADYGRRARDNKLMPDELQGGTFTITNGGVFGSLLSTPIVNPPQSGVLGMHAIQERPVAIDGKVEIRPMMYVALTYDHRIVDGRGAVSFLKRIKDAIEQPARMLLEV